MVLWFYRLGYSGPGELMRHDYQMGHGEEECDRPHDSYVAWEVGGREKGMTCQVTGLVITSVVTFTPPYPTLPSSYSQAEQRLSHKYKPFRLHP